MKILVTHSSSFDFKNSLYRPLCDSILNSQYELILPQETVREKITKDTIKDCVAVIAECSLPSTGQGIELGWANMYGVPVICIYRKDSLISPALKYITDLFFEYSDEQEMIEQLQNFLDKLISFNIKE